MARILAPEKQRMALQLLVEGSSLRSITRITGIHRTTVMNLLVRFGDACRQFMDEEILGLRLEHIQCEEIWTFVQKKQARVHVEDHHNHSIGDMYLWTALDTETK